MKEYAASGFNVSEAMYKAETARVVGRIVSSASGVVVKELNKITGISNARVVGHDSSGLKLSSNGRTYNGIIRIKASTVDSGDTKIIDVPIKIENSVCKGLDIYITKKKLSSIQPVTTRHMDSEERMSRMVEDMKQRDIEAQKEDDEINKDSKIFGKESKHINMPTGTKGGGANTPDAQLVKQLEVDKSSLPNDTEEGDTISLHGRTWCVGKSPNSFGKDDSSKWMLNIVEK